MIFHEKLFSDFSGVMKYLILTTRIILTIMFLSLFTSISDPPQLRTDRKVFTNAIFPGEWDIFSVQNHVDSLLRCGVIVGQTNWKANKQTHFRIDIIS